MTYSILARLQDWRYPGIGKQIGGSQKLYFVTARSSPSSLRLGFAYFFMQLSFLE